MTTAPSPAVLWAGERTPRRGVHWEALEARVFAAHPDLQLLLRVRGLVLPRKGAWFLAAFAASCAAALAAFGLGGVDARAGWWTAGLLMVAVAALQAVGLAWGWLGYGTGADALWGLLVCFTGAVPVIGIGLLEAGAEAPVREAPSFLFWFAIVAVGLGCTGSIASTLSPAAGSARHRRVLAAVAALPEDERGRLHADLAAALDVLVERRVIGATVRKEALAAPLGGLAASRRSASPG